MSVPNIPEIHLDNMTLSFAILAIVYGMLLLVCIDRLVRVSQRSPAAGQSFISRWTKDGTVLLYSGTVAVCLVRCSLFVALSAVCAKEDSTANDCIPHTNSYNSPALILLEIPTVVINLVFASVINHLAITYARTRVLAAAWLPRFRPRMTATVALICTTYGITVPLLYVLNYFGWLRGTVARSTEAVLNLVLASIGLLLMVLMFCWFKGSYYRQPGSRAKLRNAQRAALLWVVARLVYGGVTVDPYWMPHPPGGDDQSVPIGECILLIVLFLVCEVLPVTLVLSFDFVSMVIDDNSEELDAPSGERLVTPQLGAQSPGDPLQLALGSSRTELGTGLLASDDVLVRGEFLNCTVANVASLADQLHVDIDEFSPSVRNRDRTLCQTPATHRTPTFGSLLYGQAAGRLAMIRRVAQVEYSTFVRAEILAEARALGGSLRPHPGVAAFIGASEGQDATGRRPAIFLSWELSPTPQTSLYAYLHGPRDTRTPSFVQPEQPSIFSSTLGTAGQLASEAAAMPFRTVAMALRRARGTGAGEVLLTAAQLSGSAQPAPEAYRLLINTADGLAHLHAVGRAHGRLNPHNVIVTNLDATPMAQIVDYGFASMYAYADLKGRREWRGPWSAPEVLEGRAPLNTLGGAARGAAADIYAFSFMAWEAATLQVPLAGASLDEITETIVTSRQRPALERIAPPLARLLHKGWAHEPGDRPGAAEAAFAMRQAASRGGP